MAQDRTTRTTPDGRDARELVSEISRGPRLFAVISGVVVLGTIALLVSVGEIAAGAMVMLVIALSLFTLSIYQVVNFSPAVITRLERFAEQAGGRFTSWKDGVGDNSAVPFTEGPRTDRFAVVNDVEHGMPIEIGHLRTQVSSRSTQGPQKVNAYIAIRLPRRLPHMAIDFGHLSQVFGVRVLPVVWHRSQRVDVGGGRRFRLFVADGGQHLARAFFSPDVVRAFRSVGRSYDVEIKGDRIYLFSKRSVASGSDRRLRRQRALIDGLMQSLSELRTSGFLRRQDRGRDVEPVELRMDVRRGVIIVCAVIVAVIVIVSVLALYAQGLLEL